MYSKYSLVGIDGNVFSIIGYTLEAMRVAKYSAKDRDTFMHKLISGKYDYNEIIWQCNDKLYKINKILYTEDDNDNF